MDKLAIGSLALALVACGGARPIPTGGIDGGSFDGGPAVDGGPGADGGIPRDGGAGPDGGAGDAVTFVVTVPSGTPTFEPLFVSGNQPELGSWSGQGLALTRQSDGRWSAVQVFARDTQLEFKVTRGSWDTVEKDAGGGEIPNRAFAVSGSARIEITVAAWRDRPRLTGHIESLGVVDSAFVAPRPVLVYLPPTYDTEPSTRFPVLYFHDGQNVFDPRTSFGGVEWGADEAAESLITSGQMAAVIVVAVGNTADRIDEYTPVADGSYGGGRAADYARFLVEELKPRIDASYRTRAEPAQTGVAGSSLGGLVSVVLGLTRADAFGRIGAVSPSVWWANREILAEVGGLTAKLPLRIWVDMGTAEGSGAAVGDARALRDALVAKGWREGDDLSYREYAGARHDEASWAARVGDVLRYLFPVR